MQISEVRIKLMEDPNDRLQAFCSITFDASFVIRDLKIIRGAKGSFVAMPSRKLTDRCPRCNNKNHLRSLYCNQCGTRLQEDRASKDDEGRAKLYADIAHPINSGCRELIQTKVLEAYEDEVVRAREPNYICRYDDYGEEQYASIFDDEDIGDTEDMVITSGNSHRVEPARIEPAHPHRRVNDMSREPSRIVAEAHSEGQSFTDEGFGDGLI